MPNYFALWQAGVEETMHDTVMTYFGGEKNAGLLVASLGVIGLAAAALFFPGRWGLRSFAITLAVFAAIETQRQAR